MAKQEQQTLWQRFRRHIPAMIFLSVLVGICYLGFLNNGFVSDDIGGIRDNTHIGDLGYVLKQPFTMLQPFLYVFISKIGGVHPALFRLINILFHIGSVLLLYGILVLMTDSMIALFTASLFAVHPVLTESVVWISGGPYNKYVFFLLLSFFAYLKSKKENWKGWYIISLICFPLALSASEKCFIYPFILVVYEIAFGDIWRNWPRIMPFFGFLALWSLSFLERLRPRVEGLQNEFYQDPGTNNPFIQIPLAITMYLELLLWPDRLTLYQSELTMVPFIYIIRVITLLLLIGITVWSYKKHRFIFFFLSFFFISLIPTLLPFRLSSIVADRYVYFGAIGIFAVVAYILRALAKYEHIKTWVYLVFICVIMILIVRTIVRNSDWENEDTLWIAAARTSPSSPNNANNIGDMYSRHGDFEKAALAFQRAIALNPKYADAFHNLGNTYYQMGKLPESIQSYQTAVSMSPRLWQSNRNLSIIFFNTGNYPMALQYMQQLVKAMPNDPQFHSSLGIIYLKMNNAQEAKKEFLLALQIDPSNVQAQQALQSMGGK